MNDTLYKQLFSHPELVRDLLAGFLRADWAQRLPLSAFERVNASYASEHGKARHEDVVWRVRIGGEWVYLYILLEFQARPERWMALRMQVYLGLLYQDLVAQHKLSKHAKLPPVLPVVLYHGRRPWSAPLELADLTLPPPAGLEAFQARQRYLLVDQYHDGMGGNIVGLLFRVLRAASRDELTAAAAALIKRLRQPDLDTARNSILRWLQFTLQDDLSVTTLDLEEDLTMAQWKFKFDEVFTDELVQRMLQPREEVLQEGERLALQEVLREALAADGAQADVEARIAAADNGELRTWIRALIAARRPAA